jgi:predicted MPP superfamily phosphohydrolase
LVILFLAGVALLFFLSAGLYFVPPPALDAPAKFLYRPAFWICFPIVVLIRAAVPTMDHHSPPWMWVVASFASPFFYFALWRWLRRNPPPTTTTTHHDRRRFLKRAAATAGGVLIGGTGVYGIFLEPQSLALRRYRIPIRDLPPALDGLRIVQVSDTHLGPYVALPYLLGMVEQVNALRPDLIALTGDYVHRTPLSIVPGIGLLARLRPRMGMTAVLGNHDHWEGASACRREFARIGVPLIDNDRLFVTPRGLQRDPPPLGGGFCLAGVGDLWEDRIDPARALRGVDDVMPRLLLSHNPDAAEEMGDDHRLDLILAGHTHGGQVALPVIGAPIVPSAFGQRYAGGLCAGPACPVLVSRGVGMAVLPLRLGVPPEIVELTLTHKGD